MEDAQNDIFYDWLIERAILAAKINDSNSKIRIYKSVDTATNEGDVLNYLPELLSSLDSPGLLPHNLQLKIGICCYSFAKYYCTCSITLQNIKNSLYTLLRT